MDYVNERQEVMHAVREVCSNHLVSGTWGNVSARIAGQPLMLITPSGMDYSTMEPEDLVLVDFSQKVVDGRYKPSIETPMHLKIYQRRADAMAIVHE
ncbi:MAG: class II aldolase/adducin family protein, partial [Deltaproteobacteria bacterium]